MNENQLLRELVDFYKASGIPEPRIPAHMDSLMCKILEEIYKERDGVHILHAGERIERLDPQKLRASLELAADNGRLPVTQGDIRQLLQLSLEKLAALDRKILPARELRRLVTEAMHELGFPLLAKAYEGTRPAG